MSNLFNCRICGAALSKPVMLNNLPAVAQNLPTFETLADDKGVGLSIYCCPYCGVVQLDCEPVPYYREVIRTSAVSDELRKYKTKQFREFVGKYNLFGKRVIEIGCGDGVFLDMLKECGVDVYGTEYSPELFAKCKSDGFNVFNIYADSPETKISNFKFDAFLILNFLEHFPDPVSALRGIFNNLSDSAVGIVEVPNLDMILQKQIYSEIMRDHLFYYTADSLTNLLSLCGFDVMERDSVWHDYVLTMIVRKRKPVAFEGIADYRRDAGEQIQKVLEEYDGVSVWGASHQALFLLTCVSDPAKLRYILDSAPMKQGKYSPVSHVPIIAPPDVIDTDAVIVLAGGYTDEIVAILHKRYGYEGKIFRFEGNRLVEAK